MSSKSNTNITKRIKRRKGKHPKRSIIFIRNRGRGISKRAETKKKVKRLMKSHSNSRIEDLINKEKEKELNGVREKRQLERSKVKNEWNTSNPHKRKEFIIKYLKSELEKLRMICRKKDDELIQLRDDLKIKNKCMNYLHDNMNNAKEKIQEVQRAKTQVKDFFENKMSKWIKEVKDSDLSGSEQLKREEILKEKVMTLKLQNEELKRNLDSSKTRFKACEMEYISVIVEKRDEIESLRLRSENINNSSKDNELRLEKLKKIVKNLSDGKKYNEELIEESTKRIENFKRDNQEQHFNILLLKDDNEELKKKNKELRKENAKYSQKIEIYKEKIRKNYSAFVLSENRQTKKVDTNENNEEQKRKKISKSAKRMRRSKTANFTMRKKKNGKKMKKSSKKKTLKSNRDASKGIVKRDIFGDESVVENEKSNEKSQEKITVQNEKPKEKEILLMKNKEKQMKLKVDNELPIIIVKKTTDSNSSIENEIKKKELPEIIVEEPSTTSNPIIHDSNIFNNENDFSKLDSKSKSFSYSNESLSISNTSIDDDFLKEQDCDNHSVTSDPELPRITFDDIEKRENTDIFDSNEEEKSNNKSKCKRLLEKSMRIKKPNVIGLGKDSIKYNYNSEINSTRSSVSTISSIFPLAPININVPKKITMDIYVKNRNKKNVNTFNGHGKYFKFISNKNLKNQNEIMNNENYNGVLEMKEKKVIFPIISKKKKLKNERNNAFPLFPLGNKKQPYKHFKVDEKIHITPLDESIKPIKEKKERKLKKKKRRRKGVKIWKKKRMLKDSKATEAKMSYKTTVEFRENVVVNRKKRKEKFDHEISKWNDLVT